MVFKCKICGGALELDGARSVAVCPYCGTKQTLPKPGDERRANLYDRANHFRRNNDFDKAAGIYEAILNEDPTDAEAYWSIVLCRYGIEYVEDPATRKRVPTVNRAQYTSIFDDEDYKAALQYADAAQREVYEAEAKTINEIQRGILAISQKEEPFDVFLSCKETDASGRRTPDSVLASEIYNELTAQGIRTFFARITLEDKLGSAYEPYIFAALHSAKVMVVVGTKPEHFNAVWVKNEWSRYLALIKGGEKKTVIPAFRDMDPYDLPDEFSHLQAQDMSKLGFLQDLVRGIRKILDADAPGASPLRKTVVVTAPAAVEPLFRRAELALSDGEFEQADAFYEQILNQEPENADAYVGKLLVELRVSERSSLSACDVSFENSDAYKKAMRFGDDALKKELSDALRAVLARLEERKRVAVYDRATLLFIRAGDLPSCTEAKRLFQSISGYRDADKCVSLCDEKIAELRAEWEKLREEKRIAAEERKRRAKKTRKRVVIALLSLLLVAAIAVPTCLYVVGVAIPNAKYEKAVELIGEKRYDEAEELLDEAWYYAISKKTQDKLDRAYEALDAAKAADEEFEKAKRAEEGAVSEANAELESAAFEQAVRTLLQAGVNAKVSFLCDGGALPGNDPADSVDATYASADDFTGLPTPQKEGYLFTGWTCERTEYLPEESRVRLILKAVWTERKYVIRYQLGGGSGSNPSSYGIEDDVTLSAPTKTGYTFVGWRGQGLSEPTKVVRIEKGNTGDRLYTAEWKANKYAVSFDPAGGTTSVTETEYDYDSRVSLPKPTKPGYTFAGWYKGSEKVSDGTWKQTNPVFLKAQWTPTSYTVSYNLGGVPATNANKTSYTVETATFSLSALSYDHCTFQGWYSDSGFTRPVTSIPKGSTGNLTLYAKWSLETFTIEYDWHGGNEVTTAKKTFTTLDLPLTLCKPEKSDHSFYYWALDELDGEPVKQITTCKNYRLVANYLPAGMQLRQVTGGARSGSWIDAVYSGNATEIEIPKYYMLNNASTPYVGTFSMGAAPNLTSVSFADTLFELPLYFVPATGLTEYENGLYYGSRSNPYHSLLARANPDLPLTVIHEDTVNIGGNVFKDDLSLREIVIPAKIRNVYYGGFGSCKNLAEIFNLSSLIVQKGSHDNGGLALYACAVYTSLDAERTVEYAEVGDFKFRHDKTQDDYLLYEYTGNDRFLSLPEYVNGHNYSIRSSLFQGMPLVSVVLPAGVRAIGNDAFSDCRYLVEVYNLTSITIKPHTSSDAGTGRIGTNAIVVHSSRDDASEVVRQGDCYFIYDPSVSSYVLFAYFGNDADVILPDDVNGLSYRIHYTAFGSNPDVVSITISAGVTEINQVTFRDLENLNAVYFEVTTGWERKLSGGSVYRYQSEELADPENAAILAKNLAKGPNPIYRAE